MATPVTITPDQPAASGVTITPDAPSAWDVITQPTEKTDKEYLGYKGAAGVAGATIKGLDDVGRGTQDAIKGIYNTVRHPIDTAKGIANLPSQAAQVPAAIKDINASPDPVGTYANAAQDTVSQGAGQALTGIFAEGLGKSSGAPYVGPVGKALVKGYAKKLIPGEVGEAFKAVKSAKEAQTAAAAPTGPGAPLPEAVPPEVLQGKGLAQGGKPVALQSDALGQIPVRGSVSEGMAEPPRPEFKRGTLQDLLDQALGAQKLDPKTPLKFQMPATRGSIAETMKNPPAPEVPEGHTPVESSALKSYKYDPGANEFHAQYKSGDGIQHVFGDVSPEEAQAFEQNPSKGSAMTAIKNGHPLVAKIVNGKRVAVKVSAKP